MRFPILALTLTTLIPLTSAAADPLADYVAAAQANTAGFSPSYERGKAFYNRQFGLSADMPGCYSCHTRDPRHSGEHVITGKGIRPMAVSANPKRFTRMKKTEKWFRRNCKELLERECTAAEKANFISYLKGVQL